VAEETLQCTSALSRAYNEVRKGRRT